MIVGEFLVTSMSNHGLEDGGAWRVGLSQVFIPGRVPPYTYRDLFSCDILVSSAEAEKHRELMIGRRVLRMTLEEVENGSDKA